MKKKYTEEDLMEIEKLHRDNYLQIYDLASNIFYKTEEDYTRNIIKEILELSYSKATFSQKDINISENDIKKVNAISKIHIH